MKRLLYFLILIPFALTSCVNHPYADFRVSSSVVDAGDELIFTNYSLDADYYEWDFGDGFYSSSFNTSHIYSSPGNYSVVLSAFSNGRGVDRVVQDITVLYPTTLEVTVLEYYDEYAVPGASVILYPSLADWENETNAVVEGTTDYAGRVVFSHLDPIAYYIDVWEAHHNNYQLADEDLDFIATAELVPHSANTFTAWVDYIPDARKSKAEIKAMPHVKGARVFKKVEK
jgi:PKD repeat protein